MLTEYECCDQVNNSACHLNDNIAIELCNHTSAEYRFSDQVNNSIQVLCKGGTGQYRFNDPMNTEFPAETLTQEVPLPRKIYDLKNRPGIPKSSEESYNKAKLANLVRKHGYPNIYGAQIPVESTWNLELLASLLADYHDKELVQFLTYGWPSNRLPTSPKPTRNFLNHKSATEFPDQIKQYISRELSLGGVIGPFKDSPFLEADIGVSPLSTRPKKDSTDRRVILDLSYPPGRSVNDFIPKDYYLGIPVKIVFPRVDDLAKRINQLGDKAWAWKKDLSRAFRQYPLDPGDYHLFGYTWEGLLYFDIVLVMGHRSAPYLAQRISDALKFIMNSNDFCIFNYVDDFLGCDEYNKVCISYKAFGNLLRDLGLKESESKDVAPTQIIEFLGVTFNIKNMTMEVSPHRLIELDGELKIWSQRKTCNRNELEQLIGKLQFVTSCVRPGRIFLSRLLNQLRTMKRGVTYTCTDELHKDIIWWQQYLPLYNGVSLIWPQVHEKPDSIIATDASLSGIGGWLTDRQFFYYRVSKERVNIAYLEMTAICVALKVWGHMLGGLRFTILCDNQAVVSVLNTGRSRDSTLQQGMREVAWLAATHKFELCVSYIPTHTNLVADKLSRWSSGAARRWFHKFSRERSLVRVPIKSSHLAYICEW